MRSLLTVVAVSFSCWSSGRPECCLCSSNSRAVSKNECSEIPGISAWRSLHCVLQPILVWFTIWKQLKNPAQKNILLDFQQMDPSRCFTQNVNVMWNHWVKTNICQLHVAGIKKIWFIVLNNAFEPVCNGYIVTSLVLSDGKLALFIASLFKLDYTKIIKQKTFWPEKNVLSKLWQFLEGFQPFEDFCMS